MDKESARVKASVIVLTYNHAPFIERALEGVLMQRTTFAFNVLVLDDGSDDGTTEVVKRLAAENPSIQLHASPTRQGSAGNGARMAHLPFGDYVAWLDGDDEWTFEGKLQQQVDFLEANEDYSGTFHDATIVNSIDGHHTNQLYKGFKRYSQMYKYESVYYPWDAIERKIIAQSSLVFRAKLLKTLPMDKLQGYKLSGGWMLSVLLLQHSKFKYFNEEWSIYNDHTAGITKTQNATQFNFANIQFFKSLMTDDYYKNIKKDLYKALGNECRYILHSNRIKTENRTFKLKVLWWYTRYYFPYYWLELKYQLKNLF
ncbi:glycosyltransferase [soil metagenome]